MTRDIKRAYIVLSIPLILCLLPSGVESSFCIPTLHNQGIPVLDLISLLIVVFLPQYWNSFERQSFILYGFVLFVSTLIFKDAILARFISSLQFFIGYFLAKSFIITEASKKLLKKICFILVIFIFAQQIIFSFSLLGAAVIELDSTSSLSEGVLRVGTTIGTSNDTSHIMVILISILLYLSKNLKFKTFLFVLMFASVFISGCRGAQLMAVFPFLYYIYEVRYRSGLITLLFIGIVLYNVTYSFNIYDLIKLRHESVLAHGDITSGRTDRWIEAYETINNSLFTQLFGNGALSIPHGMNYMNAKVLVSPHNCYIGIIVETGYVGFLCIFIFLLSKLKRICKINYASMCLASIFIVSFNTEVYGLVLLPSFFYWLIYFVYIKDNLNKSINKQ